MLITLSFPIADYRMFIDADTYRINVVDISKSTDYRKSYFRSFGRLSYRYAQQEISQPNEATYAKADNGIRFDRLRRSKKPTDAFKGHFDCVFRRAFLGHYSARFDIGLTNRSQRCYRLGAGGIDSIISSALNLRFYVPATQFVYKVQTQNRYVTAVDLGSALKTKYAYATTRKPTLNMPAVQGNWFSSRTPVIVCQTNNLESDRFSAYEGHNYIEICLPETWGIRLFYKVMSDTQIPVWVIVTQFDTNKERLRALRIWLLKWHQEKQTFLGLISYINISRDKTKSHINIPIVADCLRELLDTLGRKKPKGIPADEIANAIRDIDEQIDKQSYDVFLKFLEENQSTHYLKERTKITMTTNIGTNSGSIIIIGNNQGSITVHKKENIVNGSFVNEGTIIDENNGNITYEFLSEIELSLNSEALSEEEYEKAMQQLKEIKTMMNEKKEPSMIKKALTTFAKFLWDTGAFVASAFVQSKLKDLF